LKIDSGETDTSVSCRGCSVRCHFAT
jgi:hypothetical protein